MTTKEDVVTRIKEAYSEDDAFVCGDSITTRQQMIEASEAIADEVNIGGWDLDDYLSSMYQGL